MKNEKSRLTPFIGNEPLHDYSMQVQQALNPKPESDGTENKDDFETFISKGADALIRDNPDLVKRLI